MRFIKILDSWLCVCPLKVLFKPIQVLFYLSIHGKISLLLFTYSVFVISSLAISPSHEEVNESSSSFSSVYRDYLFFFYALRVVGRVCRVGSRKPMVSDYGRHILRLCIAASRAADCLMHMVAVHGWIAYECRLCDRLKKLRVKKRI